MAGVRRGVEQRGGHLIGIAQPAFLRLWRQGIQQRTKCVQCLGTGDTPADRYQGGDLAAPVHLIEKLAQVGTVYAQLPQKHLVTEGVFHPQG